MSENQTEAPVIIAQTGPLNGKKWFIEGSITIGRDQECDIVIPDRQVSRFHTRIYLQDDAVILEDLASKNGTFFNGERIEEPVYLKDSDLIQVALIQHFVFLSSDATLPMFMDQLPEQKSEIGIFLDSKSRRVWVNNQEIIPPLSVPQFTLLQTLFESSGKVVSRQDLIMSIWGEKEAVGVSEQALDALVRRLRDRVEALDTDHAYIVTVRGHGLRLDNKNSTT